MNYPSLEITTASLVLAEQIKEILSCNGYRVTKIRHYLSKQTSNTYYKVCLYGTENIRRWLAKIGFSNPVKLKKAQKAICTAF